MPVLIFAIPLALLLVDLDLLLEVLPELEDLFLLLEVLPELEDLFLLLEVLPELFELELELELPTLLMVMLFLFTVPFFATPRILRVFSSAADIVQYKYYT